MKIATWNVQRPKKGSARIAEIENEIKKVNADIIILTETNEYISLPGYDVRHTEVPVYEGIKYEEGERRVSIYSKYKVLHPIETFDDQTALCLNIQTPMGELAVYGTILGIFGNREGSFNTDLDLHIGDFSRISSIKNLCIAGDLNMSWDNYYFTKEGRDKLNDHFELLRLVNVTAGVKQNIDHIILSASVSHDFKVTGLINDPINKKLSDHKGVVVSNE